MEAMEAPENCQGCEKLREELKNATMAWASAQNLIGKALLTSQTEHIDYAQDIFRKRVESRLFAKLAYKQHKRDVHGEDVVLRSKVW